MFFNLLSNREMITAEMAVHVPFCVHNDVQNALFVTHHEAEMCEQAGKHSILPKISQEITESNFFDIIIIDEFINDSLIRSGAGALKERGIMVARTTDDRIKDDLMMLGAKFRIAMPYHHLNLIFASNFFHPTADIVLQKSDLLNDMYYYNTEIHLAEFALPSKIRTYLKDGLKN